MEIYKSKVMGFCYGVRRALKIAEKAADSGKSWLSGAYRQWTISTVSLTKL